MKADASPVCDSSRCPSRAELRRAVSVLQRGGVVAFPTETYYGLAVDPFNEQALVALFKLKKRPERKPVLVLIQEAGQLASLARSIPDTYQELMARFWPGPLTLVFPARQELLPELLGDSAGVGVRISPHPVATELGRMWGRPITATSANLSGMPAACSADEVRRLFGDGVTCILDGGCTPGGKGSTVVGLRQGKLQLIRAGVIDFASLSRLSQGAGV